MSIVSDDFINPTIEERYELQQMLGALPSGGTDILLNDDASAVIGQNPVPADDLLRQTHDRSETSLEALERTYRAVQKPSSTSLEALWCAHNGRQAGVYSNDLTRNNTEILRESLSTDLIQGACGVPLPTPSSDSTLSSHPSGIPLPSSLSEPSKSFDDEQNILQFDQSYNLYTKYKENSLRLAEHFPHLQCVCSGSRNDRANITIFDFAGGVLQDRNHLSVRFVSEDDAQSSGDDTQSSGDITQSSGDNTQSHDNFYRKLDECQQFICSVDSNSQVETRLVVVEDLGPSLINLLGATFNLSPEFFEEHLHHSGYRGWQICEAPPSTWRTSGLQKSYVSFAWFRPGESWDLGVEQEQWEDILGLNSTGLEMPARRFTSKNGRPSNVFEFLAAKTNIFRGQIEMSTDPAGRVPHKVPCALAERATACNVEFEGIKHVILLLDPVPLLRKTITGVADAMKPAISQNESERSRTSNCISRSQAIHTSEEGWRHQTEIISTFTEMHCRTPWNLDYDSLFKQAITDSDTQDTFDPLSPFQSTAEALENWLVSASVKETEGYNNRLGPGSMIFRIAHRDTMGILQLMRSAAAYIDRASSDVELQETALYRRRRLDEFRALLHETDAFFHSFVDFLHADRPLPREETPPRLDSEPINYLFHDAINAIEVQKQRITQVYSSLTSKTQISDSHRSIAEAETVTRLTELAFLFIPLSFATSIFGMQFVSGSTPATTYIAVALALTGAAYLLRFIIHRTTGQRSALRQSISHRITVYANLREGSRIPSAIFVQWLVHVLKRTLLRFWRLSFLGATILIMLVIPLPIIWTSSLDTGLRIAFSCLLISIPTFLVGSYFWAKLIRRLRLAKRRRNSIA